MLVAYKEVFMGKNLTTTEKEIIKKAKRKFPKHQYLYLRVKKNPKKPYTKTVFEKAIELRRKHPVYKFYIHDNYLTFISTSIKNAEGVRVIIDDKLWIELYYIFKSA